MKDKAPRSCGMQRSERTAVMPLIGDHQPAVLVEAMPAAIPTSARPLHVPDARPFTRLMRPPDPPPPKRA